ncbi:hypothetical protein DFR68_1149 [Nocardia mexicana]|uniref:Uncharacterized protein n=2 Tax=Nocardia mexicana TaxID=279262 RepID=A0A370GMN0_9NOCA|nr:hypothetical protein DFR68_1149 [Nocardia mexicana]
MQTHYNETPHSTTITRQRPRNDDLVMWRQMAEIPNTVHVQMRFPQGGAVLNYRASPSIAARVATELARHGIDVHIDDNVTETLADLPNAELWSATPHIQQ